jgi:hypothetical protein
LGSGFSANPWPAEHSQGRCPDGLPKYYGPDNLPGSVRSLVDRLLPALVEGAHPALVALRQQIPHLRVTKAELTGVGFFVDFALDANVALADPPDFVGGDAIIRLAGGSVPAGCVLFVRNGRVATLEGYTNGDDQWTEDAEVIAVEDVSPIARLGDAARLPSF